MSASTPLIGIAHQIIRFMQDGVHLVGIANTQTPWEIEGIAPSVPNTLLNLPELAGYFPVKSISPVVPHESGELLSDGSRWLKVFGNETQLAAAACRAVLIEADIKHSKIPIQVLQYRSAGLYVSCHVSEAVDEESFFLPNQAFGALDTAWYFQAISVTPNQTQTLQLVRTF